MAAIPNVLRHRDCATTCWGFILILPSHLFSCFYLGTSLSDFFSGVNQWCLPTISVGCLSFLTQGLNTKVGWPKYRVNFSFSKIHLEHRWRTQCGPCWSSLSPLSTLSRVHQSISQHECLQRSENKVNYLANTQPTCTIPSCSWHHLAPQTACWNPV